MNGNGHRAEKGFSFSAILLIILGIIFLLNNFGILPWELWFNLWKFWPLLLILFGVELILGRHSSFKSLGFLLFLIFLVPIILILNPLTGNPLATKKLEHNKPLQNLTRAQLEFDLASSSIKIASLPRDSTSALQGEIKYSQLLPEPQLNEDKRFGEVKYTFTQPDKNIPILQNIGNNASYFLSTQIPYEISIKSTAGANNLDFRNLKVDLLEIESAAGQVKIVYGPTYSAKAFIKAAAAFITIELPKEIAVSIKTETAIKSVKIDESRFKKTENTYQTGNYAGASTKIDIEISGQATNLEIK